MNKKNSTIKYYFILVTFLIFFDQVTKIIVKGFNLFGFEHKGMFLGESTNVFGNWLRWTFVENAGMAFGIEFGVWKILLSLFSIIAGFALGYYLFKIRYIFWGVKTGISLIMAGALGNMVDRVFYGVFYDEGPLFYGKVVDFVQVDIPDVNVFGLFYTPFPVFNVADSCVTVGVCTLLIFNKYIPSFESVFPKKNKELIQDEETKEAQFVQEINNSEDGNQVG
jgi:signal peptidase II